MRVRSARGVRLVLALALASCQPQADPPRGIIPAPELVPEPDPSRIESVVFLIGDAGLARTETAPILTRLRDDVEGWAERLGRDSAVVVLFLGDNVYPRGMSPPGSDLFPRDSAILADQAAIVSGPAARRFGAQGYFVAGNHDWGLREDWDGYVRILEMSRLLDRLREEEGAPVRFVPEAGTGGPYDLDLGRHLRIVLLDTAWWILDGGRLGMDTRASILEGIRTAMATADGREILIATHHPFRSAGPHGGEVSFWRTLGIRYLLTRSGALLQDLSSIPFRDFEASLRGIFAEVGPPLLFAGGHEHALQLFERVQPTDPGYTVVSGSASKRSGVSYQTGILFGSPEPGYMRLLVGVDGSMTLFVEAAPEEYRECKGDAEEVARCVQAGVAAFRIAYGRTLR